MRVTFDPKLAAANPASAERARVIVRGAVQGVGFRPFVYRHATELDLPGWVINSSQGVFIEVEGDAEAIRDFILRIEKNKPPRAVIQSIETSFLPVAGYERFEIRESDERGGKSVLILPDIATCPDCTREIFDPANRRYRYPFTNCTNCGPRFSIIEALPYDRRNTSMRKFTMCADCDREYHDPLDRRFHAQPNACPKCGPRLELWDEAGAALAREEEALQQAAQVIREGRILALKGIGGFQLIVDARSEEAVRRLRARKHREEKPFAVMVPSPALARNLCEISPLDERLLLSPESPITLMRRKEGAEVCDAVAPRNPYLGVMLPYSPLHHLLLGDLESAVVATSGNLTDEPICTDEHEALDRLRGIADFFLVHDRPIVRHVDDSIGRIVAGREQLLRRARGYAPLPIHLKESLPPILATGAHIKSSVALSVGTEIFVSQHIGDLETAAAHAAFRKTAEDLPRLYDVTPEFIAHDLHPDYLSTQYARQQPGRKAAVQHHYAHVLACMAENEIAPPALGVAWDGTGYGTDGTIWGGEFLLITGRSFRRIAHLRQFRLPGRDVASKEPRRSALGVLYEMHGAGLELPDSLAGEFSAEERRLLLRMLAQKINSPLTSSAGRLFDAVAALSGLRPRATFEGQAAMELEFRFDSSVMEAYPFEIRGDAPSVIDWEPMIREVMADSRAGVGAPVISARFHNTLAELIVATAARAGESHVVLTGGCFQNCRLTERAVERLREEGFQPVWHQRLPANDGGIAPGQIIAAAREARGK